MGPAFPAVPDHAWFKSSYSGGNQTECVEAAHVGDSAAVRDSKHPLGPSITFARANWAQFIHALRSSDL
ncbi:hypothetical protein GCM10010329_36360 [Streptomyces spiroverticillatus]|uniref:DUF397 domain-containing protein n=1 Tax=Streptomyces finlayi TaxID=67296 RepID=A0A918WYI2_9ACTN|nr:DUF397 domain-containing protein [Streptomyces finlayi]GHA10373.1 hypothetical protein GCM10010329_36360 [Streptomyces spiroverticillatus]GHC95647.1 hypothetical protein GCM10010334_35250 [Streptomyces finlayi]